MSVFQLLESLPLKVPESDFFIAQQLMHCQLGFYYSVCQFERSNFSTSLLQQLHIQPYPDLNRAVPKRQAEFVAGRYAAKLILEQMGWQGAQVGVGSDRCPVWPNDVVGSISHNHNQAICVASDKLDYLGVDIENTLLADTALSVAETVATTSEVALLMQQGISHAQGISLIFSAKESLFKAIYPRVGRYLEFDSSQLVAIDMGQRVLKLKLNVELQRELKRQQEFCCFFDLQAQQVTTLVYA